jgi:hypothetical protein
MSSQHARRNRNYRPEPSEYDPAHATIEQAGHNMDRLVRAMLRWFNADPQGALATLAPYLAEVEQATPRGRPPVNPAASPGPPAAPR